MTALSDKMMNSALSLDKDTASLTESGSKLRKALLDQQANVMKVDAYTHAGSEGQWERIRNQYTAILNKLDPTAKLCADTIDGYLVLLPDIDTPELFDGAIIELTSLSDRAKDLAMDQSPEFKELCDNIAQFISETGSVVTKKNQEADVAAAEARQQVTRAQAEVARLQKQISDRRSSSIGKTIKGAGELIGIKKATPEEKAKLDVKGQIGEAVDQATSTNEEGEKLERQLKDAEQQVTAARDAQARADALVRASQNLDWPLMSSSLNNVKTLAGTVASKQLVISSVVKMFKAAVDAHLAAFIAYKEEKTPEKQLALANATRKARDDEPKLRSIKISLDNFAYEFK